MQLRKEAKIRRFAKIARRSIASISVPGRIGHSLDDECLDIATSRRDKYVSLLNLNRRLTERSSNNFDLRISKSLTTSFINDDSHDSNDDTNSSSANDLSVAEKSMKILGLTAEDVMDACARIQERSYWNEQEVTAKTSSEAIEEVAQFSLKKDGEETGDALEMNDFPREKDGKKDGKEIIDALRSQQTTVDEKAANYNLMNEIVMRNSQIETEKDDNDKIVSIDKKEQILIDKKQESVSSTKSGDVTFVKVNNRAKSIESPKLQEDSSSRKKKRDEAEKLARIERCLLSSAECKNARNMKVKPCASLVRKLEEKLRSTNKKWLDQVNQSKHSYQVKLTPTGSDANKKECYKNSRTSSSCACHRALKKNTDTSRNEKYALRNISTDTNDKNVKRDIDRKEFQLQNFVSVHVQKNKMNECDSAFKYSEAYRLKKQIQKFEGSSTKQTITWGSMSLAQTARSSGYTKDIVETKKPSAIYRRNIQTEACDESSDSLNARYRSIRSGRSMDSPSIYNASFKERNYARSEKREMNTSDAHNDLTFSASKRGMRARRRHELSPNCKLSNEEREAVELKALRTFKLTLLEDKKKLEAKQNHDLSLNHKRLMDPGVPEMKVFESHNDLTLLEEQREMDAIGEHNLSSSYKLSIEESSASKIYNETSSKNKKELKVEGKHEDSSKYEAPEKYKKNAETLTSSSNHLSEVDREETGIISSETRRNADRSELSYSRQAYMSLNLREITRNIEWTVHPWGIILINKNLHRQFLKDERPRESRQRDIVDDNIASTLHSAFFFKPEIVTRVFRRAQTRFGESFPNFPTFWREDFNTEFICRVNNETVVQWDSSSFDLNLERIPAVRSNLVNSSFPSDNRVAGEDNRDLCIIFLDQEQVSNESETAIIENSTIVGSQEDGLSSIETTEMTNILLVCILRDFGVEVSEESDIMSSVERIEEYGDMSNMVVGNVDFSPSNFNANGTSPEEEDDDKCDRISLRQQVSNSDDVTLSVNLPDHDNFHNLPDKNYIDAIDISSEKRIYENNSSFKRVDDNTTLQLSDDSNNNQFDTLINKSEKSIFNRIPENVSQLSFSDLPSLIKEDHFNRSIELKSSDEELQKLTQLSKSETTLENQRKESVINSVTTNYDTISQSANVETLNLLKTIARNDAKSEDRDTYEKANLSLTHPFSKINQDEWLRQDDSFYSMCERDNDSVKTIVSEGDVSLMEEFSNNTISLGMSSNTSIRSSAHS